MQGLLAKRGLSLLAIVMCCGALQACAVQSTSSKVIGGGARVSAAQVEFDPRLPTDGAVSAASKFGGADAIAAANVGTAKNATGEFMVLFSHGFKERFPDLAARYGLAVSPTAAAKLRFRVTQTRTYCTVKCTTRVTLLGELFDSTGKPVWNFTVKPGQVWIWDKIDDALFDAIANELLESMKKDGVIGR